MYKYICICIYLYICKPSLSLYHYYWTPLFCFPPPLRHDASSPSYDPAGWFEFYSPSAPLSLCNAVLGGKRVMSPLRYATAALSVCLPVIAPPVHCLT